ncbi:MAG: N-acetylmuramoyl-L-alanine amidase [Sedimentisphaerales bacterium]|nr:N-acetylmuramoyl-L-alanine amidase [Sedimentisphaerales bacterium]
MCKKCFRVLTALNWLLITFLLVSGCGPQTTGSETIVHIEPVGGIYRPLPLPPVNPSKSNHSPTGSKGWIPPRNLENPGRWKGILIHHTATSNGNAAGLDRMHKDNGWDGLGYHFVIDNGHGGKDGQIEVGWRWQEQREGAHCRVRANDNNYWNEHTIGIALVGNFEKTPPTNAQYESLAKLVSFLQDRYDIPRSQIKGHGDVDNTKCPGRLFSFPQFFAHLQRQQNWQTAK